MLVCMCKWSNRGSFNLPDHHTQQHVPARRFDIDLSRSPRPTRPTTRSPGPTRPTTRSLLAGQRAARPLRADISNHFDRPVVRCATATWIRPS